MNEYEATLLEEFQEALLSSEGHLDETGQALLRAIGRGSPELYAAVEKLMDRLTGFAPVEGEFAH